MGRTATALDIVNRAALEVGLIPTQDPVGSGDDSFLQLTGLLIAAGQELVELHPWQILEKQYTINTSPGDSGTYDLPDDFAYMIDQTGWDRTNRVALGGPLSPQDWAYLKGRDLVSQSIYASFRIVEGKVDLFPQPPPPNLEIDFLYINRNWVVENGIQPIYKDHVSTSSDEILFDPILVVKFLKLKFLQAKGFPADAAALEFENIFNSRTGKDTGAPILSASRGSRGVPYLNSYYNTPDTGYGG